MSQEVSKRNQKDSQVSESGADSKDLTLNEFSLVWARLCAAYPKNETTSLTVEVYFERLAAFEKQPVLEAIGECLDECKWFPAISEIVERIKSPRGCIHRLMLAQIRSREAMLMESEKHAEQRLKKLAQECAELENKSIELYRQDAEMLEQSGLAKARAELDTIKRQIQDQQRILNMLRQKVKIFDQVRILQSEH